LSNVFKPRRKNTPRDSVIIEHRKSTKKTK
jgi:hypothetical protein